MKRVYFFDIARGFAIACVVIIHTLLNEYTVVDALLEGTETPDLIVTALFFFGTMGGVFYIITGCVVGFSSFNKIKNGLSTPKQIAVSGSVKGVILVISNYIFRLTFSSRSGFFYFLVRNGTVTAPPFEAVMNLSTLAIIGWTYLLVSCLVALIFRNNGHLKITRNNVILILIGSIVLGLTIFVRIGLADIGVLAIEEKNFWVALPISILLYDDFPLFPYAIYGIYGAVIGIPLANSKDRNPVRNLFLIIGTFWIALGFILLKLNGGIKPTIVMEYTDEALMSETFRQMAQVGIMMVVMQLAIDWFDFASPTRQKRRKRATKGFELFGKISLTIFIIESMITAFISRILNSIPAIEGWSENLGNVAILALTEVAFWTLIVYLWSKYDNKWSLEHGLRKFSNLFLRNKKREIKVKPQIENI